MHSVQLRLNSLSTSRGKRRSQQIMCSASPVTSRNPAATGSVRWLSCLFSPSALSLATTWGMLFAGEECFDNDREDSREAL